MTIVKPIGNIGSKIAFVGEAPGEEELVQGKPFVGAAGQELNRILQTVGIDRNACYITNVVPFKLSRNDFSVMYTDKKNTKPTPELLDCWKRLEEELQAIKPNVIVPLGSYALHAVCGIVGIGKWRGSILQSRWGTKAIPTYHPSGVLRSYELRPIVIRDLVKAKGESWHPFIKLPQRNLIIRPSLSQVFDYIKQIQEVKKVAVDIETYQSRLISCIGLSCDKSSAICVPFICENDKSYWDSQDALKVKAIINDVLADPTIEKYGQNFHYDWCWLKRDGYEINNFAFDTMVSQHCIAPEMPKDLGFLVSLHTNEPYYKDEGKEWRQVKNWEQYWTYNCKDAACTFEIVAPLKSELTTTGTWNTFNFEMSLIPQFVDVTLRGFKFDVEYRNELRKEKKDEAKKLLSTVEAYLPLDWVCSKCKGFGEVGKKKPKRCPACDGRKRSINLDSPTQIKKLLLDGLELKIAPKRKTGKISTDVETLKKLAVKTRHPIFEALIDYSKISKQLEFFNTKIDSDHRIRTTLACVTETGRLSSSGSPFGTGTNLQNIERSNEFRKLFVADEGMILYAPDYSQAEARVVAHVSGDLNYLGIFDRNEDIHTVNAQTIFEKEIISDLERQLGKRVCHGLNYLMGVLTLCDYVLKELGEKYAITPTQARKFATAYFRRFQGIKEWHLAVFERLKKSRTLENCFGRKRAFFGRLDAGTHRTAVAWEPQSTVADLTNRAINAIISTMPKLEFLLQVHDQLIFQGSKFDNVEEIAKGMKKAMAIPMTINGSTFTIPVDMKVGRSWGELKNACQ